MVRILGTKFDFLKRLASGDLCKVGLLLKYRIPGEQKSGVRENSGQRHWEFGRLSMYRKSKVESAQRRRGSGH